MRRPLPEVDKVEHRYIQGRSITIHIAEAGHGDPVVMLHGWPQHWYMWRHQILTLAEHYRVICPDLRGFGWSDAPKDGYVKEQMADDMVELFDSLELKKVRLIGHDWGGWIGFLLCLRQPERIHKYLALNIAHPFQKLDFRHTALWRFWYQLIIASPLLGLNILWNKSWFVRQLLVWGVVDKKWTEGEVQSYVSQFQEFSRAYASVQLYRTFLLQEFRLIARGFYLKQHLSVPTLLLFGDKDFAISKKLLKGYEAYAVSMRVEYIHNCGHFIVDECPEIVTQQAINFFK